MENRVIKFRVIYDNKITGYERLTHDGSGVFWEWMELDLNPDNGRDRWCYGVYPYGYDYKRVQFTGLHDKNGNEIYESDVWGNVNGITLTAIVSIHEGCWSLLWTNGSIGNLYSHVMTKSGNVIGNIFETPDLLK